MSPEVCRFSDLTGRADDVGSWGGGKADIADDQESIITIGSVDSGLAASRRPGMTFLTNSSVARPAKVAQDSARHNLVDSERRHGALVGADGAIMLGDKVGSIHRIGAVAQGSEACDGWTFWHVETNKGLKLIDELRAELRSGMATG